MSMRQLHDLSRVYLESVAAKPDYLDFDKDGNKKESMKKALKDKKEVTEAVKGQDTEMRKAASAERRAGDTLTKKLPAYKGKEYGKFQKDQISYINKKTKGKHIPGMANEALDPVGREDVDIDNDGDTDKSDKYLHKRRKAIGKAIATRKESFSNWRQDLAEVMDKVEKDEEHKQIKEKKNINNKIVINPELKESIEEIGGVLLEVTELEEGYKPIGKEKESAMYRRAGNLARTSLSSKGKKKEEAQKKSSNIVSAITRQKEKERFDRIGQSPTHNEEFELDEKTLTPAETKKKEEIVKLMKKSAGDFEKRYPGRGKEVMYATATKQAKKLAEAGMPPVLDPQSQQAQADQADQKRLQAQRKQKLLQILQSKERAVRSGMSDINASYEAEGEVIDERRREDKGKPRPAEPSAAFKAVSALMGSSRSGVQPRGEKKVPGRKQPPSGQSPAQRVAMRRASAQRSQSMMHSPRD